MRAIGLTLLACLMLLTGRAFAFDPTAAVFLPPPKHFNQLALENDIIIDGTTWITNWESAKQANPNVQTWASYNPGIMWYDHNKHSDDPFVDGGFIKWHELQKWSIDAKLSPIVQANLKLGVDWFVRDKHTNKPLKAYGLSTATILNTTASCPRSKVPGPYYNLNVMETYAKLFAELASDRRYRNAVDVIYLDMGGNLWSTLWDIRGGNISEATWNDDIGGWIPAYMAFIRLMQRNVDMPIHVNSDGESWIWLDQNGSVHNHYWADGYKMENPFAQLDWRRNLSYHEQFKTWLGPYIRKDNQRGNIKIGLEYMKDFVGAENIVIQTQANTTWTRQENRRHVRMCLALWLLSYEKGMGPYFSLGTYWDTNEKINPGDFPEFTTWAQIEPTDAPLYTREIDGKTLYLRKMKLAGRWNVLLAVNPNEEWVYGVPAKDAMILILNMFDFQYLMQWHRIL